MKIPYFIGLPSWIIQDGNYEDFKRGDQAAFALEFNAPAALDVIQEDARAPSLEHLHSSIYRILGKVIHVRDCEWWAIDVGTLMYKAGKPPPEAEEGDPPRQPMTRW